MGCLYPGFEAAEPPRRRGARPPLARTTSRTVSQTVGMGTSPAGGKAPAPGLGPKGIAVIREELSRLFKREERHRRLLARLILAFAVTIVIFAVGTVLIWAIEGGQKGGDIHGVGDAAFFTAVQLLTVSSSAKNPLTSAGKIVDVALEVWAIFVVTAVAGSFATFFTSGDSG
jgi:hypothetical protein